MNSRGAKNKAKIGATTSGLSVGFAACHTVCQTLIAALAIFGVTVLGIPLAFLDAYKIPLLGIAAASLSISVWLCKRHNLPLRTLAKPVGMGFVAALLIVLSAFTFNAFTAAGVSPTAGLTQASNPPEKCAAPSGYTEAQWREHMGHHPDLYAECLK